MPSRGNTHDAAWPPQTQYVLDPAHPMFRAVHSEQLNCVAAIPGKDSKKEGRKFNMKPIR